MRAPRGFIVIACFTIVFATVATLQADEVQQTTHVAPVPLPKPTATASVRFSEQPARVGDRVAQQIDLELDLTMSIIQSGQVAAKEQTSMAQRQQRLIEVVEVAEGKVRRARVTFSRCRHKSPESKDPQQEVVQPVEGKTYLVTRQGKQLLVTDPQGAIPPRDEFKIVLSSMQSLGKPNPLAQFLLQHTIRVGQTIELPQKIAEQMLGFGSELGRVEKFELRLNQLSAIEGVPCAVFEASIKVAGDQDNPTQIDVTGPVVILTETCRTVETDLTGPLSLSTVERTSLGSFTHQATGTMRASVRSRYAKPTK